MGKLGKHKVFDEWLTFKIYNFYIFSEGGRLEIFVTNSRDQRRVEQWQETNNISHNLAALATAA